MSENHETMQVDLGEAHHLICFGVRAPNEFRNRRHLRVFETSSIAELSDYMPRYVQAGQRVILMTPEGNYHDAIKIVDDGYEQAIIGERTLVGTSERVGVNMLTNISHQTAGPWITDFRRPLEGRPAFVIYSGPSLDKNIHLLEKCSRLGAIITTNTPSRACVEFGVRPDIMVCLENRKVVDPIDDVNPTLFVCDMTASPDNWVGTWYYHARMFQPDLAYLQYAVEYGTMPIGNGGFVGSTAINIAYLLGANPIVLLGFDLALTDDRTCSSHIGSDTEVSYDGLFVDFKSSHPCNGRAFVAECEAYGGEGKVKTTFERIGYRQYLEKFASLAKGVELFNATEGGSRIAGWKEKPLHDLTNELVNVENLCGNRRALEEQILETWSKDDRPIADRILSRIRSNAEQIVEIGKIPSPSNDMEMRRLARDEPLIFTLLAPRFVAVKYQMPCERERLRLIREITIDCAKRMLQILEEI